jgi:hypothetical protein
MNEHAELTGLMESPPARRLLLLLKALEYAPFDRAIELARTAEVFVTGSGEPLDSRVRPTTTAPHDTENNEDIGDSLSNSEPLGESVSARRSSVALSIDQRERLLTRFAEGARNAELATEFGLSPKQIQGIRMGCAREIAKRRDQLSKTTGEAEQNDETAPVSVDDVVRYLRQQEDIVVRQDNGEFLVNARFPMTLADLIARANRMRERQGKPKFDLPNGVSVLPRQTSPANGHPMFWEQTAPHEPLS